MMGSAVADILEPTPTGAGPWRKVDNALVHEAHGLSIRLEVQPPRGDVPPREILLATLPGAAFLLHEWTTYVISERSGRSSTAVTGLGSEPQRSPGVPMSGPYRLRNRVGRASIVIHCGPQSSARLDVEVLSTKFSTEPQHEAFFDGLLSELVELTHSTTFVPEAETAFGSASDPRGPTVLSDYHTLRRWTTRIETALDAIVYSPHRLLAEVVEELPIGAVSSIDGDVLEQLVMRSDSYVRTDADWPVARALGGFVPTELAIPVAYEAVDTPENRFIALLLSRIAAAVAEIRETSWLWDRLPDQDREGLEDMVAALEQKRNASFLGELPASQTVPFASQVLQRRAGYEEAWRCWQELSAGRLGVLSDADWAIANRDVATLYEIWAFFALTQRLTATLGPVESFRGIHDVQFGVRHRAQARFADGWSLQYNQGFRRASYSLTLKPDYSLVHRDEMSVVFDAKFRFEAVTDADSEGLESAGKDALPEMLAAKADDLYKMHTYRDALGLDAALIVFPGTEDSFYRTEGRGQQIKPLTSVPLDRILSGKLTGVGAISLRPGYA